MISFGKPLTSHWLARALFGLGKQIFISYLLEREKEVTEPSFRVIVSLTNNSTNQIYDVNGKDSNEWPMWRCGYLNNTSAITVNWISCPKTNYPHSAEKPTRTEESMFRFNERTISIGFSLGSFLGSFSSHCYRSLFVKCWKNLTGLTRFTRL